MVFTWIFYIDFLHGFVIWFFRWIFPKIRRLTANQPFNMLVKL